MGSSLSKNLKSYYGEQATFSNSDNEIQNSAVDDQRINNSIKQEDNESLITLSDNIAPEDSIDKPNLTQLPYISGCFQHDLLPPNISTPESQPENYRNEGKCELQVQIKESMSPQLRRYRKKQQDKQIIQKQKHAKIKSTRPVQINEVTLFNLQDYSFQEIDKANTLKCRSTSPGKSKLGIVDNPWLQVYNPCLREKIIRGCLKQPGRTIVQKRKKVHFQNESIHRP